MVYNSFQAAVAKKEKEAQKKAFKKERKTMRTKLKVRTKKIVEKLRYRQTSNISQAGTFPTTSEWSTILLKKTREGGIYHTKAVAECIEPDRFRSLCCELISGKCLKP